MEWISVKDSLPELRKEVHFTNGKRLWVGFNRSEPGEAIRFCKNGDPRIILGVTHWSPAPELPKLVGPLEELPLDIKIDLDQFKKSQLSTLRSMERSLASMAAKIESNSKFCIETYVRSMDKELSKLSQVTEKYKADMPHKLDDAIQRVCEAVNSLNDNIQVLSRRMVKVESNLACLYTLQKSITNPELGEPSPIVR